MIISVNEILDYLYCPMLHKYKYVDKIINNKLNIKKKYEEDMHSFLASYHMLLQNNGIKMDDVKKIFANLWVNKTHMKEYQYVDSGDYRNSYEGLRRKGIDSTMEFHLNNKSNEYRPLIYNYVYKIDITNNIELTGIIDLVRERDGYVELVEFKPLTDLYRKESLGNDFETVSMIYATEYIYNMELDFKYVYLLDKKKYIIIKDYNKEQFRKSVIAIAKCIKNKLYYRANYDRCYKCIYINECSNYTAKEE